MTEEEVSARVYQYLHARGEAVDNTFLARMPSLIKNALNRVALVVAEGNDYDELQKTLTSSPVSGLAYASGVATITDRSVLIDTIRTVGTVLVTASGVTSIAKPLPKYENLFSTSILQSDLYHYAVRGNEIHFKDKNGTVDAIAGTGVSVKVHASFVPTLSELPSRFESMLVESLALLAIEGKKRVVPKQEAVGLSLPN